MEKAEVVRWLRKFNGGWLYYDDMLTIKAATDMLEAAPDVGALIARLSDPKPWMIENVGPIPLEREKRDRWLTTLGILVHYASDVREWAGGKA